MARKLKRIPKKIPKKIPKRIPKRKQIRDRWNTSNTRLTRTEKVKVRRLLKQQERNDFDYDDMFFNAQDASPKLQKILSNPNNFHYKTAEKLDVSQYDRLYWWLQNISE